MTLEQALTKLEEVQKENIKLRKRVEQLEKVMYEETMYDYEDNFPYNDSYDDDYFKG